MRSLLPGRLLAIAGCLVLVSFAGCANDGKATVDGTITFDGKPIPVGSIVFTKTEGGLVAEGAVIREGVFRVALPLGTYKVQVNARKVVGKTKAVGVGDPVEVEMTAEMIPDRYNAKTELSVDVKSGTRDLKLELHSK